MLVENMVLGLSNQKSLGPNQYYSILELRILQA